jgi:hypothetical protein
MMKVLSILSIFIFSSQVPAYWGTDYGIWTYKISLVRSEVCKFTNPKSRVRDCVKMVKAFAKEEDLQCNGFADKDRKDLTNLVGECSDKIKILYKEKALDQRLIINWDIDWEKEITSEHYQKINVTYPDFKWNFWLVQKKDLNNDSIMDHAFLGSDKFRYCIGIIYSNELKTFKKCFKRAPKKHQTVKAIPSGTQKEFCGKQVKLIFKNKKVGLSDSVCNPFIIHWSQAKEKFY